MAFDLPHGGNARCARAHSRRAGAGMAKPDVLFYSPYRREDKMATSSLGQSESPHVTGSKSDAKPDEPTERLTSTSLTPTRMATACPTSREHSLVADIGHGQINHGAAVSMAAHDCRREPGARLTPTRVLFQDRDDQCGSRELTGASSRARLLRQPWRLSVAQTTGARKRGSSPMTLPILNKHRVS